MWLVCHRSEVHALRGYPTAGLTAWLLMPVQRDLLYACHVTLDTPVKGSRSISSAKSSYCIYVAWDDYRLTGMAILIAGKKRFSKQIACDYRAYLDVRIFYHQHNCVKAYLVYSRINCNH